MEKLIEALKVLEIPHEVLPDMWGNNQVWYPARQGHIMDAICHKYSYGGDEDLLEIMGLLTEEEKEIDDVIGYLTAEDVLARIIKHRQEEVKRVIG